MQLKNTIEELKETLFEIRNIDPATGRNIIANYDDFIDIFSLMVKVRQIKEYVSKAASNYRDGINFFENNSLISARNEIKENKITDENLRTADLQDYTSGKILTLASIEQRLTVLGLKG